MKDSLMDDVVIITSKNKTARKRKRRRFTRVEIQRAIRMIEKKHFNGA